MTTPITTFAKASSSILDYGLDWSDWLASGESLSCSIWTVDSGLASSSITTTTSISTVWLSQGTRGQSYEAKNTIWTSGGRKAERTIKLKVLDR